MIAMILLSPMLTARFGKKTVALVGFALMTIVSGLWYFAAPHQVWLMFALTMLGAAAYGPTIPVVWSIYADVADFSEWKTGRNAMSIVFATICFALKSGLGLGSFLVLSLLTRHGYVEGQTQSAEASTAFAWSPACTQRSFFSFARCCSPPTESTNERPCKSQPISPNVAQVTKPPVSNRGPNGDCHEINVCHCPVASLASHRRDRRGTGVPQRRLRRRLSNWHGAGHKAGHGRRSRGC